ncbi:AAA family ATPase [Vibrio hyugaensis]|uniref:AAA family ATPase n=1 Tax=Vibrio hyugaensis TaxID=1534743 RepID=UPI000CE2C5FE|nr:AAA family ATPase [Vibrio hyugaensis]
MNNLIVFTGGPGAGKTSVIEHLIELGYHCAPEAGRKVIQQQVAIDGDALPWRDKVAFRDEMVREEKNNHDTYGSHHTFVFFDRCIIDSYGYSKLESLPVSDVLLSACHQLHYAKQIFIFPPWGAIFANDKERKQDFTEAMRTYEEMVKAYHQFGYELIEVPKQSVEQRVKFILSFIQEG